MTFEFPGTDAIPPEEAFALLGHEVRIGIVTELYEAGGRDGPGRLSYAELKERVGIRDSGKFNYHLTELLGVFVREYDAGYGLPYAGREAYRAVATGLYHGSATAGPVDLAADCPACESTLVVEYRDDRFRIGCGDCPMRFADVPFPIESARALDPAELLDAVDNRLKSRSFPDAYGFCPHCGGPLAGDLTAVEDLPFDPGPAREVMAMCRCESCRAMIFTPVGGLLVHRSPVVAFHERRGRDLLTTHAWEIPFVVSDDPVTVERRDPLAVRVDVAVAGDTLPVAVTEALDVRVGDA